ncbi:hypothetical protein LRP52_49230, partial [Photobacterium sp. ZSDE20]|nr:hypothetical protein [Photobacterium sp. ZSDE20]
MDKDRLELFQKIIDRAQWLGSENLKNHGWCITSDLIEDELFILVRESGLTDLEAIEILLTERFDTLILVELERETKLIISPHSDMLKECIQAFELGFYNVCIPSLFSIIEASLMHLANKGDYKSIRYVTGIRDRVNSEQYHYSLRDKLNHIANTTEALFSKVQFDSNKCDTVLNRHASVHGRRETSYTKPD